MDQAVVSVENVEHARFQTQIAMFFVFSLRHVCARRPQFLKGGVNPSLALPYPGKGTGTANIKKGIRIPKTMLRSKSFSHDEFEHATVVLVTELVGLGKG
jgi:hypothetical protein